MNAIAAGRSSGRCRPRTTRNGCILSGISQSLLRASRKFAWAFMPTQSIGRSPARTIPPEHAPMRGAQAPRRRDAPFRGRSSPLPRTRPQRRGFTVPMESRIGAANAPPLACPRWRESTDAPPIGGVPPFGGDEAHITSGTRQLRPEIQRRTSSARHAVIPTESRIGAGNSPALTRRQRVDLENGTNRRSNRWRTKPV